MIRGTAKMLAKLGDWIGDARVYEVDPPVVYTDYDYDSETDEGTYKKLLTSYVIVSATTVPMFGPETYIFPAEKQGDVFEVGDWCVLDGSFRGEINHEQALANAGYTVV